MNQSNIIGDDIISETDGSSDNRDEDKVNLLASNYCEILKAIGEDPNRAGLADTPMRAAKAFLNFTEGYHIQVKDVVGDGIFHDNVSSEPITVKDIDIFSLCEHHLVPFYGKVHISYIPRDKILGLSKLPRIAEVFARRLQLQERLTQQIATAVLEIIDAKGVGVVIEASHMCMCMRGVQKVGSMTVTRCMLGVFAENPAVRSEFLSDIRHH